MTTSPSPTAKVHYIICRKCGKKEVWLGALDCQSCAQNKREKQEAAWICFKPPCRIRHNVACAVRRHIKHGTGNIVGAHRTAHYLGYPLADIVEWAKANGYNPPKNHIDHIVPIKWWLARYPDDIIRAMRGAWNLGNLRIVPAAVNMAKGARREFLV